jgi:EmrB/QacA subfamily drug resistance transporter
VTFPGGAGVIRSSSTVPECVRRRFWVLAAAILGSTLAFVDKSVVNVALPDIESSLRTSLAAMQWVVNAYALCMSALLLFGGAAADQFGRRLMFIVGVSVFAVASIGAGLAPNVQMLIATRAVQGTGAALLIPCALALIGAAFDEQDRGAAIGIWAGASAFSAGAAPILGGWLVDHSSWRVIFLINPLVAIPTLWIAVRRVPESRNPDAPPGVDWLGALLAVMGLGGLAYGLIASATLGWNDIVVIGSLSAGVVLSIAFVLTERVSSSPMMPLELFRSLRFSGINLLTLLLYGALGAAFFFLPFLLIQARGYSATAAGAAYVPFTLLVALLSRWSGKLGDKFGARWLLISGPVFAAVAFALLGSGKGSYWITIVSMAILGFGMGVAVAPLTTTVMNAVPPDRTGVASGINNAVASVGSLLLIGVLGSVALGAFDHSMDRELASVHTSPDVRAVVDSARGGFVVPPMAASLSAQARQQAHAIINGALAGTVRMAVWVAALLALAGALTAVVAIRSDGRRQKVP